ncbi:hypothetical protein COF61_26655 [Bacillus toyonensis]|nr:hypothetical protein COF61_26655 [Bacillus toyonensis]
MIRKGKKQKHEFNNMFTKVKKQIKGVYLFLGYVQTLNKILFKLKGTPSESVVPLDQELYCVFFYSLYKYMEVENK